MIKRLIVLITAITAVSVMPAFAAEKTLTAQLDKDYTIAKFNMEFEEPGDYEITLTEPGGHDTYEASQTGPKSASCVIQDAKEGKWNITIRTESPEPELDEEGNPIEIEEPEIGKVKVTIEGSFQESVEVSKDIKVAQDIAGLEMFFRDETFVANWQSGSQGGINITITDAKTQQQLVSETVRGSSCEYELDPDAHERIVVTLVPSESSNVEGASVSRTMETANHPDARINFEDVKITNRDSIAMQASLDKAYKISAYLNDKEIISPVLTEAGDNDFALVTDVGQNDYLVYVTDPDTGYMRSYTYSLVKDVVAPTIKMAKSYENITTTDESITFEGSIDPDYKTFTINDADIRVAGDHTFKQEYALKEGDNNIHIEARDEAGNVSEYNATITRVIPEVAKVPWFPIIIGVCLVGLAATYIITAIMKSRREVERYSREVREAVKKEKRKVGAAFDVIPVWLQEVLRIGLPVICLFIIFRFCIFGTTVMSGSMEPKLKVGTTAVFNRLAYRNTLPERGDIILFWSDEFNAYFEKRVIGLPGDEIEFKSGYVFINGQRADESEYIAEDIETNSNKTFKVPEACVFVLGDNREYSYDSRYWNNPYIPLTKIKGKYIGGMNFSIKYMIQEKTGTLAEPPTNIAQ